MDPMQYDRLHNGHVDPVDFLFLLVHYYHRLRHKLFARLVYLFIHLTQLFFHICIHIFDIERKFINDLIEGRTESEESLDKLNIKIIETILKQAHEESLHICFKKFKRDFPH